MKDKGVLRVIMDLYHDFMSSESSSMNFLLVITVKFQGCLLWEDGAYFPASIISLINCLGIFLSLYLRILLLFLILLINRQQYDCL